MITRINKALMARSEKLKNGETQKGFTLIELLVVVIIIGILAAIAIPVFLNQRESAWRGSVESDVKNAAIVVETYGAENNGKFEGFPTTAFTSSSTGEPNIKVSADNTVTVTVATDNLSYEIEGYNANVGTTIILSYDSEAGGLVGWSDRTDDE